MHHCIKYRLNQDGTIPAFLCLHPDGVGGAFVVSDPNTPNPRDMVMIGLSENDNVGDAEIIPTQQELQTYLAQVGASWEQQGESGESIPFDPVAAAQWVWDRLTALNNAN